MNEAIKWILHHWDPILTVLAFSLSLITFTINVISSRRKIKININNYTIIHKDNKKVFVFNIDAMNCSKLSISLNEIRINDTENNTYIVRKHPSLVTTKKISNSKSVEHYQENHSVKFPINIASLSSEQCFIELYVPNEVNELDDKIVISTNRGVIKTKIELENKFIDSKEFTNISAEYFDYIRI